MKLWYAVLCYGFVVQAANNSNGNIEKVSETRSEIEQLIFHFYDRSLPEMVSNLLWKRLRWMQNGGFYWNSSKLKAQQFADRKREYAQHDYSLDHQFLKHLKEKVMKKMKIFC